MKFNSETIMKTNWLKRIPAAVVPCLITVSLVMAMSTHAADKKDASKPARGSTVGEQATEAAALRPDVYKSTGSSPAQRTDWNAAEWKDPKWPDPGIVLTNIVWDYLPLAEVARILREQFKNHFEVVLPNVVNRPPAAHAVNPATGLPIPELPTEATDPTMIPIRLQLKRVTATELFNAMNLMFETENSPWRWQLLMNGNRPTAVFRILPDVLFGMQSSPPPEAPKKQREVIFVGDFIGDPKSGGMTDDEFLRTLADLYQQVYEPTKRDAINELIRYHSPTQILVVTGTDDERRFMADTLRALRQKLNLEQRRKFQAAPGGGGGSGGSEAKSEATKTP